MTTTSPGRSLPITASGPACCPSGLNRTMDRASAEALARLLKAVADPARLQLLALIRSSDEGESCACDLTEPLGLSQPTVSHHLKILTEAGLITRQQRGTWAWFALVPERIAEIATIFQIEPSIGDQASRGVAGREKYRRRSHNDT